MMKNISIFIMIIMLLTACESRERMSSDLVPEPVKTTFYKMYPKAVNPLWYLEKGKYEAEFDSATVKKNALFEGNGVYIKETVE